eukprot:1145097-Pelagomonas_calceolata.AAC.1
MVWWDVPLFWKELARVTDYGSRWNDCSWHKMLPVPSVPPNNSQRISGTGPWHSIGTAKMGQGICRFCEARWSALPISMEARPAPR